MAPAHLGVWCACVLAASCNPSVEKEPATLSLQLATRQSCGLLSGLDYDTSCLAAVDVRVLDAGRAPLVESCRTLAKGPEELRELLRGASALSVEGITADRVVTFEVRGLHAVGLTDTSASLCDRAAQSSRWLFFGESEPVDLRAFDAEGGSHIVPVVVDCRDCTFACGDDICFGCGGIGTETCSAESFPTSFCVPAATCDKTCAADADCFGGARRCVDGRCDAQTLDGALCSPCGGTTGASCLEGLRCVARATEGAGFCAPLCPDETCVSGTKCNRLNNNLVLKP